MENQKLLKPVCAVYDKKLGLFDPPFTVRHVGEAQRDWSNVVNNKDTKFGKNPEDFDLYMIGHYDEVSGNFENIKPHVHLQGGASAYV